MSQHKCDGCGIVLTSCSWCTPESHTCDECRAIFEDDVLATDEEAVRSIEQRRITQALKRPD